MKIKVKPQDFIVDEIAPIEFSDKGQYAFFRLRKKRLFKLCLIK